MSEVRQQRQVGAFVRELLLLEKRAQPGVMAENLARVARAAGARPRYLAGLLGGAATGALVGAGGEPTGSEEDRHRRLLMGAGLGALGGAGAARGLHWLGQGRVSGAERLGRLLSAQYYGLTGKLPGTLAPEQVAKRLREVGVGEPAAVEALSGAAPKDVPRLRARLEAVRAGLETAPGILRSLLLSPQRTLQRVWGSQTPLGKTIMLGAVALPAHELATTRPGDYGPGKEYKSRAQHVARELGTTLGYTAGGVAPVVPVLALGAGLGEAGKALGSLV